MRRLLPTALAVALLLAAFAGVASARLGSSDGRSQERTVAPFRVPASPPAADRAHPGSWGYRSSTAIARRLEGAAPTAGRSADVGASAGPSATVTITATVLPVVILVVDDRGALESITTNTPERDGRGVLYLVREDAPDGAARTLDAALWADARSALARAEAGTGTVWNA